MGSDESHFNVSLIVRDKVERQCPQTTIFEEKGQPKRIRTEVPLWYTYSAVTWLVPHEIAAVSTRYVYTLQPCTTSLHAKTHR